MSQEIKTNNYTFSDTDEEYSWDDCIGNTPIQYKEGDIEGFQPIIPPNSKVVTDDENRIWVFEK